MNEGEPVTKTTVAIAVNKLVETKKIPDVNSQSLAMSDLLKQISRPGGIQLLDELLAGGK